MSIRNNHIIGPRRSHETPREEALRRLRAPGPLIESRGSPNADVADFVVDWDMDADDAIAAAATRVYCCSRCGVDIVVRNIRVEGTVRCSCRDPLVGKPI